MDAVGASFKCPVLAILKCPFLEAAVQHAGSSASKPKAKPVDCEQPTGTVTAITRLRRTVRLRVVRPQPV